MYENYSPQIQRFLKKNKIEIGHRISVSGREGVLMPKSAGDPDVLVIKLDNGYNIGIAFNGVKIKKLKGEEREKKLPKMKDYKTDPGKKTIVLLHTGGTVASRIDYKTGAAYPAFTPEDLFFSIPELKDIANFHTRVVFQMYSGDMEPEHWILIAQKIAQEIEELNPDGIIVTHGTDTMTYTAAALSLMLQNLPIPVLLAGAQRSSDRGSSDTAMNLICAAKFIAKTDFAGVAVCLHGSINDEYCLVHPGLHVKKMHTARRDTFRSIDVLPYAKAHLDGEVELLRNDYPKRNVAKKLHMVARFDRRIALINIHPAIDYKLFDFLIKSKYRGVILEGTGLGNAPVNVLDEYTKHHQKLLDTITRMAKKGIVIGMVSQCPYGKVNMNVYSYGRKLLKAGVIPLSMTSEAAFVKLGWSLGQAQKSGDAKKILLTNYAGEFIDRIDPRAFLY